MDAKPRFSRTCSECATPNDREFKKVLELQKSGLIVYEHVHKQEEFPQEKKVLGGRKNEFYVLHNASHKDLKRPDFINELCQYRTRCYHCKVIAQKVHSFLEEITAIKRNEVLGVCMHCKKVNPAGKCRRCESIINKFCKDTTMKNEDRQIKFLTLLCKIKEFLESFLEEEKSCRHQINLEGSATELHNLLEQLKLPLNSCQPDLELFTSAESEICMSQSKEILEELLNKLKYRTKEHDKPDFPSSASNASCICKHIRDRKFTPMVPLIEDQVLLQPEVLKTENNENLDVSEKKVGKNVPLKKIVNDTEVKIKKKSQNGNISLKQPKEQKSPKEQKFTKEIKEPKPTKEPKPPKKTLTSEDKLMLRMIKQRELEKKQSFKPIKKQISRALPKIDDLPPIKFNKVVVIEESSESVIECPDQTLTHPAKMIKGQKILSYAHHVVDECRSIEPILFKTHCVCPEPVVVPIPPVTTPEQVPSTAKIKQQKHVKDFVEVNTKGIINYELSNRDFIHRGWTQLPTTKIMRRMNVYRMVPANPQFDWFKIHKRKRVMFYDTGETLAEIDPNGCGRWYYKNGSVALNFYNTEELNSGQRYVVNSYSEEMDSGKLKPCTVLASFDYAGNGVVYDHCGNMRLKYNQSEGIVIDSKIGPPGRWKWHTLNDPPVLHSAYIDVREPHLNPRLRALMKTNKAENIPKNVVDHQMLSIELDNFLKEKARKLLQKFKPFQIRTKVVKLNDKFSLRIMDQANINLAFRDGSVSLKLNLGMLLLSDEIIDTDTSEVTEVGTPYDRHPPRRRSVADIQRGRPLIT